MRPILVAIILLLHGCSTIATVGAGGSGAPNRFQCDVGYRIPRVYSGVANDARFIGIGHKTGGSAEGGVGIAILDLPFSLIADTLVLPYTIFAQAAWGDLCKGSAQPSQ
jgi:uncharacterized protein YceK